MGADELKRMLDKINRQNNSNALLFPKSNADENISAATIDATGADAHISRSSISPLVKPGLWRRVMSVLTPKQRRDEYLRKKDQQRNTALTIVPRTAVVPQTVPTTVSETTSIALQSPSAVHGFDNRDTVLGEYRELPENVPAPISVPRRPWFLGLSTVAIGLGLAAVGLVNNYHFNAAFGHSSFESQQLGALGFLIDAVAITSLPASTRLWEQRHRLYSLVAFSLWLAACIWSMNTTASFTAQLTGDQAAKRSSEITASQDTRDQRSAAITIAADAVKLAKTRADKAKANTDLAKANATPIISTPLIATAEPEHMFATAAQNRFIRITGATIFPSLAGLFLAFGMLLLRRR